MLDVAPSRCVVAYSRSFIVAQDKVQVGRIEERWRKEKARRWWSKWRRSMLYGSKRPGYRPPEKGVDFPVKSRREQVEGGEATCFAFDRVSEGEDTTC